MRKIVLIFVVSLLALSCNNLSVYDKSYDFDKNQWQKNDVKTFDFTIDKDDQPCDVVFTLSHVYDYQFDAVPLTIIWTKPDGTTKTTLIDLRIKDENGKELGDCAGDICDIK